MTDDPIPTDARGMARDFLRRSKAEYDECYKRFEDDIFQSILPRLRRYPHRNLRPEHIHEVVKAWDKLMPQCFCLHLGISRPKPIWLEIFEIRVAPTTIRMREWDDNWLVGEVNLALANTIISLGRKGVPFQTQVISHIISFHALARRYQRCQEWSDASVLRDIRSLMQIQPDKELDGKLCAVETELGSWRGNHTLMTVAQKAPAALVAVRTYVGRD